MDVAGGGKVKLLPGLNQVVRVLGTPVTDADRMSLALLSHETRWHLAAADFPPSILRQSR